MQALRLGMFTATHACMMKSVLFGFAVAASASCSAGSLSGGNDLADSGPNVDGSTPAPPYFRTAIQSDLSGAGCLGSSCHGGGTMPMQLTASPSDDAEWEANYQQASAQLTKLIPKAGGDGGHPALLTAGEPMLLRWQAWIDAGAPYEASVSAPDAGTPADAGPAADATTGALSWNGVIRQTLLADGCTLCHGLQGGYSVETYSGTLGFGSDQTVPNVIPGDANSLLITYYDDEHHTTSAENAALVRQWIVEELAAE